MSALHDFREQYPQYDSVDDDTLATSLHQKYYADIDYGEFRSKAGLADITPIAPTLSDKIDIEIKQPKRQLSGLQDDGTSKLDAFSLVDDQEQKGFWENAFRRMGERATELGGQFASGAEIVTRTIDESLLGGFVWDDESIIPRYAGPDELSELRESGQTQNIADRMKGMDFDAVPQATWETVKETFEEEGVTSGMGEVLAYAAETGIASTPDMAAVIFNMPAYVFARSAEIGETRAQNKGKDRTDLVDMMEAAPFALGSAILERIGGKGIIDAGTEAVEQVGKEALKTIAKRAGGAAAKEASTEFIQEGMVEYVGERFGTGAEMDFMEAMEQGLAGAVAGGVYGGVAAGTGATAQKGLNVFETRESQLAKAMDAEVKGAEFVTPPSVVAAQILDPNQTSQMEAETVSDYVSQGMPAVVGMSGTEANEWQQAEELELDMSTPARMERAQEQGFDTETTYYHGTTADFTEFQTGMDPANAGQVVNEIYLSNNPEVSHYATGTVDPEWSPEGANIIPVYVRGKGVTHDIEGQHATNTEVQKLVTEAREGGADYVVLENASMPFAEGTEILVFNPTNIRSVNAAFAPGTEASADLLGAQSVQQNAKITPISAQKPIISAQEGGISAPRPIVPRETLSMATPRTEPEVMDMGPGTNYAPIIGRTGDLPLDANRNFVLGSGRKVRIPKQPVNRKAVLELFKKSMGVKIFTGRVKRKGVLGFYKPKQGELRIKYQNDLEVAAHEVAHWMDEKYPWIKTLYKKFPDEMAGVSYDSSKDFEGYAEFMRLFMTQEQEAIQRAPSFYDAWMAELNKPGREKLKDSLFDTQELMHSWHLQGWRKRMAGKIGDDGLNLAQRIQIGINGAVDKTLQKTLDKLHAFKVAETEITGGVGDATVSPYKSFRLAAGHMAVTKSVMNYGTINWTEEGNIEFTGKSLRDIFAPVEGVMEDMQLYMVARRAQELDEQGRENLFRKDEYVPALELGTQNPAIKKAFEEWLEFNERMMDFYQSSGVLGTEQRKAIEEMNKNYVPFNRIVDTANEIARGNKNKVAKGGSPFMRLKGGSGNINDVFDNILSNTSMMIHMALLNKSKQSFYDMTQNADNQTGGMYAAKIAKDMAPVDIDQEQVKKAFVQGMGMTWKEWRMMEEMPASAEEIATVEFVNNTFGEMADYITFFQQGLDPKGNVDFVFRDGKKEFYEIVDDLLFEAIGMLGPQSHNIAVNILGGFANILRRGTTATPTFQIKNFIRDTMNAFTLSKGRMVPAVDAIKAIFQRVYDDPVYWEYMANGGGFATQAEADGINADRIMDPTSVLAKYDEIIGSMELANRLAEFKAMKNKGASPREAAFAGREISTDFAMRGASQALRVLTISIPFMNARLQGHYRIAREIGERQPDGKFRIDTTATYNYALRSVLGIMIPSMVLYMINRDDERYLELPEYVKDLSWFIPTGTGEDEYILMPKPFESGMLWGSVSERMMGKLREEEHGEELTNAMLWMGMETFGLDLVPQAFKPWDDLRRNKNFTGAPIIPSYMESVEPSEQYRAYTSDAMLALGRKMNISPIKAEYIVRGYFGTLGTWALGAADYMVGDLSEGGERVANDWEDNILISPFVNDGPLRRTKSETQVYNMLKETRRAVNTVNLMTKRDPERLAQYLSDPETQALHSTNKLLERQTKKMRELRNAQDRIRYSADMTGEEKKATIQEIQRGINAVTRATARAVSPTEIDKIIESIESVIPNEEDQ